MRDVGLFFSGDTVRLEDVEGIQDGVKLFAKLKDAGVNLDQIKDVLSVLRRNDLVAKVDTFLAGSPSRSGLMSPETDTGNRQLKRGVQEQGDEEGKRFLVHVFYSLFTSLLSFPYHMISRVDGN